jgi:hypothetical protein
MSPVRVRFRTLAYAGPHLELYCTILYCVYSSGLLMSQVRVPGRKTPSLPVRGMLPVYHGRRARHEALPSTWMGAGRSGFATCAPGLGLVRG